MGEEPRGHPPPRAHRRADSDSDCARDFSWTSGPAGGGETTRSCAGRGRERARSGSSIGAARAAGFAARRRRLLERELRLPEDWPRPGDTGVRHALAQNGVRGGRFSPHGWRISGADRGMLAGLKHIILVECVRGPFSDTRGARLPGTEDCAFHVLAPVERTARRRLAALVAECGVESARRRAGHGAPALPEGAELTPDTIACFGQPAAGGFDRRTKWSLPRSRFAAPFFAASTIFCITGGAIGKPAVALAPRWHARIAR